MTFIHCDCFKWSKQTKKEMLVDLEALMRIFRVDIFAVIEPQNKKLLKFSIGMGFNHLKDFVGTDGKLYYLFVRRV